MSRCVALSRFREGGDTPARRSEWDCALFRFVHVVDAAALLALGGARASFHEWLPRSWYAACEGIHT